MGGEAKRGEAAAMLGVVGPSFLLGDRVSYVRLLSSLGSLTVRVGGPAVSGVGCGTRAAGLVKLWNLPRPLGASAT